MRSNRDEDAGRAEFDRFRIETSAIDAPSPDAYLSSAAPASTRRARRRPVIWVAAAAAAVCVVAVAHASQHQNRPAAVAPSPAPSPAASQTDYRPPGRITACPGAVNCLTPNSVPAALISSVTSIFPGSMVTCQASSFDGSKDLVTVEQVCLTSRLGESLMLTLERLVDPDDPTELSIDTVKSGQSLVYQRRAGWVLSVLVTNPNSRTPAVDDISAAVVWVKSTTPPA